MSKIIPLLERDGRETYFHGAVLVPDHRTGEQVIHDLKRIYGEVIGSSDQWTYDDIFARLRREGYTLLENDEVFWEDEADPIALPAEPIQAEVHSDDHKAAASFDARLWFDQATDEDIRDLAAIGWCGNYEADAVARYMEDRNEDVAAVFTYARTAELGFECHVEEASALAYLAVRRPALHAELTTELARQAVPRYHGSEVEPRGGFSSQECPSATGDHTPLQVLRQKPPLP